MCFMNGYSTHGITCGYSTRGMWVSTRGTTPDVYAPRYEETWSTQTRDGMHGGAMRDCTCGHAWKNEVVN